MFEQTNREMMALRSNCFHLIEDFSFVFLGEMVKMSLDLTNRTNQRSFLHSIDYVRLVNIE